MNKQHYDLISIGAGSGGLAVAEIAAQAGKKVAVVEASRMGGTCVNNGCVPKKVMWYAAQLAHAVDDASDFGVPSKRDTTQWSTLTGKRDQYIHNINNYWDGYVAENSIERINGYATFVNENTIEVNGVHYTADHIVIATGSQPIVPPVQGAELGIISDQFFALEKQPENVAIVGGGYIGVELAGVLNALGSKVSVFAMEDRLLHTFDDMISKSLEEEMNKQGIAVHTLFQVNALSESDGVKSVHSVDGKCLAGFDSVIWAVGRRPNTANLKLENAGVDKLPNGIIPVDGYGYTNINGVYAIGDVTGKATLTPVAIAVGRVLANKLFVNNSQPAVNLENVPSVVFAHPAIATVGITELQAKERYDIVRVYTSSFVPMRYSASSHGVKTSMKLIAAGEQEQVVGIHMMGDGVDEMLQGFAVAVNMGATKSDFDRTIAIHPTSAEELVTMKNPDRVIVTGGESEWKKAS